MEDLKAYLISHGYDNITLDAMTEKSDDAIGLFLYNHIAPSINDGSGTRYIQVQVRRREAANAYTTAHALYPLLDSGPDEEIINLTEERWCIGRIRALPKKLHFDTNDRTTYYFEVALWGTNEP